MSSLWTPGGEHPVEPEADSLTPEQQQQLADAAEEMSQIQSQLANAPVESVVANHCMGLFELAAIHLNREEPNLPSARLAIDALGGVLDACKGRLGEGEKTLVDARAQLQMAFVNVTQWVRDQGSTDPQG